MKVLTIGPTQSASTPESEERRLLQAAQVDSYVVLTPRPGERKLAAILRMMREGRRQDVDTVSAQDPFFSGLIAWCLAWRARARFNVQVHTDIAAQPWWRRALARVVLLRANSVRAVSEKIKKQVEGLGVHAPIAVLPVYVDVSRFKGLTRRPEQMVLWLGRFEHEKDPLHALDVIAQVSGAKLVMLGAGRLEAMLKEKAKNLPVEFPGWKDPLPYIARAGVVLSTSHHESYGVSIVEALAAGVPVVAPDVGIARQAGAEVVPRDQLAEAVKKTLHSGVSSVLKLNLLSKEEWAAAWQKTL